MIRSPCQTLNPNRGGVPGVNPRHLLAVASKRFPGNAALKPYATP